MAKSYFDVLGKVNLLCDAKIIVIIHEIFIIR